MEKNTSITGTGGLQFLKSLLGVGSSKAGKGRIGNDAVSEAAVK